MLVFLWTAFLLASCFARNFSCTERVEKIQARTQEVFGFFDQTKAKLAQPNHGEFVLA